MEFLLNFLLNYITLSVAGIAFVLILAVLFEKKGPLFERQRTPYRFTGHPCHLFRFILIVTITSGSVHPAGGPTPIRP